MNDRARKHHDIISMTAIRHWYAKLEQEKRDKVNEGKNIIRGIEVYQYQAKGTFNALIKLHGIECPLPIDIYVKKD